MKQSVEYRDEEIELDADDVLVACAIASDIDGRTSPGNLVTTLAQWVATIRQEAKR